MRKNEKGFTLVELLAVIMISSIVLIPLMLSLNNNFIVNSRQMARSAASIMRVAASQAINEIPFMEIYNQDSLQNDRYLVLDRDTCNIFYDEDIISEYLTSDEKCEFIFNMEVNNVRFDQPEDFTIYVYPYALTSEDKNTLLSNNNIPELIRNEMSERIVVRETNPDNIFILYQTIYIRYGARTSDYIVNTSLLSREWVPPSGIND